MFYYLVFVFASLQPAVSAASVKGDMHWQSRTETAFLSLTSTLGISWQIYEDTTARSDLSIGKYTWTMTHSVASRFRFPFHFHLAFYFLIFILSFFCHVMSDLLARLKARVWFSFAFLWSGRGSLFVGTGGCEAGRRVCAKRNDVHIRCSWR